METVAAFFGGNPLATPLGQRIGDPDNIIFEQAMFSTSCNNLLFFLNYVFLEQATDGSLAAENWAWNMDICDMINETDEGPKDAVRAIRKRFQQNAGKNHKIILYTLSV